MKKQEGSKKGIWIVVFGAMALAMAPISDAIMRHERKEVAGLAVVFGVEPEPALTEEMQFLRWRVSNLSDEEPYGDFQDAKVMVTLDGEEYGPFDVRGVRRSPGQYQTQHIFTQAGEYTSVLSFRKGEDATVHSVDFNFNINSRSDLEIPKRRHGGGN